MSSTPETPTTPKWLPPLNSTRYYLLLGVVAIFILGPLGGVTAAYMNFSLGFFVGGQVLAGILGSAVTYGYGAEGKHGANYMQTMAASVAGMSGMAVLIQAMVWLGLEQPPAWALMLYFLCIGMFGVGVGMLYTPFLVDRMQLTFPSGYAVANILRALTDAKLLRASIGKLGTGTGLGFLGGLAATVVAPIANLGISTSTIGAGMVVGARIAIPGMAMGLVGEMLVPYLSHAEPWSLDAAGKAVYLTASPWLEDGEPFRKIGFIVALGMILGAAIVDMALLAYKTVGELSRAKESVKAEEEWKQTNIGRLIAWVVVWGVALFLVATQLLALPPMYVAIAMALVFLFLVINGISTGISDSNPISSAFVLTVFILGFAGLTSPIQGLMCASILLIATSVGVDMQQDRSTGWRLGTNRTIQFRYQVIGIVMGSVMSVGFASIFMTAYPALETNQFAHSHEKHEREATVVADRAAVVEKAESNSKIAVSQSRAAAEASRELRATLAATPDGAPVDKMLTLAAADRAIAAADSAATAAEQSIAPPPAPIDAAAVKAEATKEQELKRWQSAMTYKFVGALGSLTPVDPADLASSDPAVKAVAEQKLAKKAVTMTALQLGIAIGLLTELLRKIIKNIGAYQRFASESKLGFAVDFSLDAFLLPSPYASSFGGFVELMTTVWFAMGGVLTSFGQTLEEEVVAPYKAAGVRPEGGDIPEDMSTTSLVGGGLIAGDSLAALALGIWGLAWAVLG